MKEYVVECEKLRNNIELIKKRADGRIIYAVVKANGYGLGLLPLTRFLRDYGIDHFAVTEPSSALRLRMAGFIDEEILIMRPLPTEAEILDLIEARAVATVGSYDAAVLLNGLAEKRSELVDAHVKIDTGLGRYGFLPTEFDRIQAVFRYMPKIRVTGLFTHFSSAFSNKKKTRAQMDALFAVADKLRAAGQNPGCVHAANSSYLFRHSLEGTDAVRIGSAFTGRLPLGANHGLERVGYARASVAEIRWLAPGQTVGYGDAYTVRHPTRVAIIPLGYFDGFNVSRERDVFRFRDKARYLLSDAKDMLRSRRLYLSIKGRRAPVLGHIGMLNTIADVTDIHCEIGDEAIFEMSPLFANPLLERVYLEGNDVKKT